MTYAIPAIDYEPVAIEHAPQELVFVPRSRRQWIPFLLPLALCSVSYLGGGLPLLTDLGFTIFTILMAIFLTVEFYHFPRRFGIGGLLLWGGSLAWFCQDYFTHWYQHDYSNSPIDMPAWVVAKAATLHVLFIMLMSISLNWNTGKWLEKMLLIVPDPENESFYLFIILLLFCCTICPYVLFNAEPWYLCMYHALFGSFTGQGPLMTVYRDGNLNYSWGAYVAQIMQVGETGGILAVIYAILIATSWPKRLLGISIWLFNAEVAFQSGRRGNIAFEFLPVISVLFIKYQAQAASLFRRFSFKAYLVCGILTVFMQFVVQFEGTFRAVGYANADISQLDITKNQGNTMFSEGLAAFATIPDPVPYFYGGDFPLEGALRAMPQTAFDCVIGIIPRALWNNKPIDPLWAWYNRFYTGIGNGVVGTTISHGLVGCWYFKFGPVGMMEGALLVGWLIGTSERALQHSEGKPISIMVAMGFATWLFRDFRDFIFIDLYGLVLGVIAIYIIVRLTRPFLGRSA
jgi:hypothetical protein